MRKRAIVFLLLIFVVVTAYDSYGQRRNKYGYKNKTSSKKYSSYKGGKVGYAGVGNPKYWTIGASINGANYFGDLTKTSSKFSSDYKFVPAGFGLTVSKGVLPGIFMRGAFNYVRISGDDADSDLSGDNSDLGRWSRNYSFRNDIKELSFGFEADMIPTNRGARGRFPINPYLFAGVALFHHAPKAKAPEFDQAGNPTGKYGEWVDLQSLGTEGQHIDSLGKKPYPKIQFSIPVGLGVKIRLPKNFDLNVEVGFRYLFTDYLDDVGGNYADLDAFGDNYIARAMSERGANPFTANGTARDLTDKTGGQTVEYNYSANTNPDTQWTGGDSYTHGNNYVAGNERGSSKYKDFLVVTQIRLVYIIDKKGMSKGKFR